MTYLCSQKVRSFRSSRKPLLTLLALRARVPSRFMHVHVDLPRTRHKRQRSCPDLHNVLPHANLRPSIPRGVAPQIGNGNASNPYAHICVDCDHGGYLPYNTEIVQSGWTECSRLKHKRYARFCVDELLANGPSRMFQRTRAFSSPHPSDRARFCH
jgi:hypothetical protein